MASFALITEGITDQVLLEALILSHVGKESIVNPIQPMRDATDASRQQGYGGWERVLEHCHEEAFASILSVNDFIVLHVDTDIVEHPNFGIALTEEGKDRPVADLINAVREKIIQRLGPCYAQFAERIVFAIAVHSIECWLLPYYAKVDADYPRIKNCAEHLARLAKLKKSEELKTVEIFQQLVQPLQNTKKNKDWQKNIAVCRDHNESIATFLASLPSVSV